MFQTAGAAVSFVPCPLELPRWQQIAHEVRLLTRQSPLPLVVVRSRTRDLRDSWRRQRSGRGHFSTLAAVASSTAAAAAAVAFKQSGAEDRGRQQGAEGRGWRGAGNDDAASSSRRRAPREQRGRPVDTDTLEWGGLQVVGHAVDWLRAVAKVAGGTLTPTPIQEAAMVRIFEGEDMVLQSPTGTGKSLAFLLPLLQRMELTELRRQERDDPHQGPGLRMLVLVPSADLQMQIVGLIRQLVGPGRAEGVALLRRDSDNSSVNARIVVATSRQIAELLEDSITSKIWSDALKGLDVCVVDEADRHVAKWTRYQMKQRSLAGLTDPCIRVLQRIVDAKDIRPWQLVGASATVNRVTMRKLAYAAEKELKLVRAEGSKLPSDATKPEGQYGDDTSSWPEGLTHTVRVVDPFRFPNVLSLAASTIIDLQARRTLVIVAIEASNDKLNKSYFGLAAVTAQLRFRLESNGFKIVRCSDAVEAAAASWSTAFTDTRRRKSEAPEVIVGISEAMRGIHFDNLDAVVIIGDPPGVNEYMHAAGRTCRLQPGFSQPVGGTVVSIAPESVANRLINWGKLTGFKIFEVPVSKPHPPHAAVDLAKEAVAARNEDVEVRAKVADVPTRKTRDAESTRTSRNEDDDRLADAGAWA